MCHRLKKTLIFKHIIPNQCQYVLNSIWKKKLGYYKYQLKAFPIVDNFAKKLHNKIDSSFKKKKNH